MRGIVIRMLVIAAGLAVAAWAVPGISVAGPGTLAAAALLLGFVNAFIRPIIVVLTLPLTLVTFGVFLLVVNAAMLGLVAWLLPGFLVAGFWSALFGWLVVVFVSWVASWYIGPRGRYEIVVIERRR